MNPEQVEQVKDIKNGLVKYLGKYNHYIFVLSSDNKISETNIATNLISQGITDKQERDQIVTELQQKLDYLSQIKTYLENQTNVMGTMKQNPLRAVSNLFKGVKKETLKPQIEELTELIERIKNIQSFYSENPPVIDTKKEKSFIENYNAYINEKESQLLDNNMRGGRKTRRKRNKRRKTIRRRI
jgi:hypothetical protein